MKKILVTGANGQLGNALRVVLKENSNYQVFFTDYQDLDITIQDRISEYLDKDNFFAIINCAAYTTVDKAEEEKDKAYLLNSIAPKYLSIEASKRKISLIHISTDYVFGEGKNTPLSPFDKDTNPQSVYGKTKLEGEYNIEKYASSYMIIRTAWLYSEFGNNFLKTMLRLGRDRECLNIVYDQVGSPTYAVDLATAIVKGLDLLTPETKKIFHYSNEGVCSWYDFAKKIMEIENIDCRICPILSSQYPTAAKRPAFSVLDKKEIKEFLSLDIPHWEDSVRTCLQNIQEYSFKKS